jgi:hypothetical protein
MARPLRLLTIHLSRGAALSAGAGLLAFALLSGCGSDDSHPPLAGDQGGAGHSGSGATSGSGDSTGKGGRAGATTDGGSGEGGEPSGGSGGSAFGGRGGRGGGSGSGGASATDAGGDAHLDGGSSTGGTGSGGESSTDSGPPPAGGSVCPIDRTDPFLDFGRHDAADPTFARFGGISSDELSVAWASDKGDVYVADRSSPPGMFDPAVQINDITLAADRPAMSPTGFVVLAVADDRASLVEYRRSKRSTDFARTDGAAVGMLNVFIGDGGAISEPVLGGDKLSLFFLLSFAGGTPVLYESKWSSPDGAWGTPRQLSNPELASDDADHRRRPTGASSDGRTLFYYDEVDGIERAAWRNTPDSPFNLFLDIGDFSDAAPNLRCNLLYYAGTDRDGTGLFTGG